MIFENLQIGRIVAHEIFQRDDDRGIKSPRFANNLETLSDSAMGAFRLRMTEALSGQSQSIKMRIIKHDAASFLSIANKLMGSTDEAFLQNSRAVATRLAEAQMARKIPGGMVIVFDGTVGANSVPFIGVIKAETQAGFRRADDGEKAILEFLENIFLTPATRLYKIGMMVRTDDTAAAPTGWHAFVFDSNISKSNREAAALYFYEGFLGCAFPSDGPYETAKFFDLTKDFIARSELSVDQKRDLVDSLYVFVRDEQAPTFTTGEFADRYLPQDIKDTYSNFLKSKRFPDAAIVRDTSEMGNRFKRRRLKFGKDIELSASPEALADKVEIRAISGESMDGIQPTWTQITIREALTGEQ